MPILGVVASSISGHLTPPYSTDFYSIQTLTVDSGGASSVTFSSIPSTYTHLQIRCNIRNTFAFDSMFIRFNGDSGSNYSWKQFYGTGSGSATASYGQNQTWGLVGTLASDSSSTFNSATVTDILDYKSTSKNKTVRSISGSNNNASGNAKFISALYFATPITAISSLTLYAENGSFKQYSTFALYGVK